MQTAVGKPGKGVLEEYLMKVLHVDALADYRQLKGREIKFAAQSRGDKLVSLRKHVVEL